MLYTIEFTPAARRDLAGIKDKAVLRKIDLTLRVLRENPRPPKARKLSGALREYHRIRVGDFRIIYLIEDANLVVCVVRVRDRKDAYR